VRYGDFYVDGGYEHGKALLSLPDRPTAIFAGSDMQALGVLRAARELGLRVPDDVSVVGFDNVPESALTNPPLTTVDQPIHRMGAEALRLIVDLVEGNTREPHVRLPTTLVVRGTTRPL